MVEGRISLRSFHNMCSAAAFLAVQTVQVRPPGNEQSDFLYWWKGKVERRFWNIVPIDAQDAKSIFYADVESLLTLTSVMTEGHQGVRPKWKKANPLASNKTTVPATVVPCGNNAFKQVAELEILKYRSITSFLCRKRSDVMHTELSAEYEKPAAHLRRCAEGFLLFKMLVSHRLQTPHSCLTMYWGFVVS